MISYIPKKPIAVAAASAIVGAIGAPAIANGKLCEAQPPYRHVPCDAPGLIALSTNASSASDSYMISVIDNIAGEERTAPARSTGARLSERCGVSPTKSSGLFE